MRPINHDRMREVRSRTGGVPYGQHNPRPVAFDTETYPVYQSGKATCDVVPRLVCLSYASESYPEGVLLAREDAVVWWCAQVRRGNTLVGANLAFDLNVMLRAVSEEAPDAYDEIFELAYAVPKYDVQVAARLADIAMGGMFLRGGYSLAQLEKRYLDDDDARTTRKSGINVWRLRYNELDGVPVDEYPEEAHRYAIEDAVNTWRVYNAVLGSPNGQATELRSHYDWLLSLMSAWGVMVDQQWTASLLDFYHNQREEYFAQLQEYGLIRPETGTKNTSAIRDMFAEAFLSVDITPPVTPTGQVATNKQAMNDLEDAGALTAPFVAYSKFNRADKFISTYLQPLIDAGTLPLCPRYNVLVDSGRTSSSGPNVQNFPSRRNAHDRAILEALLEDGGEDLQDEARIARGAIVGPDIRGALVSRPGYVFVAADYAAIEMAGVAQCARNITGELGTLAHAVNQGLDLHCYVGAQILGISYDEMIQRVANGDPEAKRIREVSKIGNYGGWGGAQGPAFRSFARQQGVHIDLHTADTILRTMRVAWSEMDAYFRFVESCRRPNGTYSIEQHGPNRLTSGWRRRVTKRAPQALNTLFQGIVADGALWSLSLISQDIYLTPGSPLEDSHVVLFVHDEFVLETPAERAADAAARLSELMVTGMRQFLPDLRVDADAKIVGTRWQK